MAPKQKTFELIPENLGLHGPGYQPDAVLSKPPMTTKQAKKLYREKNKGPKISKAEQRRIELMEQNRIRKEFEKEKAQARARTARERKKDKEEKQKEERRRKGPPLVDIHPSQDTISKFINRMGFGKKPVSNGERSNLGTVQEAESETATEAESETEVENEDAHGAETDEADASDKENHRPGGDPGDRLSKKRRLTQPNKLLDRMIHIPSQRPAGAVARFAQELDLESQSRGSSVDTDDMAAEAMVEDQLIADAQLASSRSIASSSPISAKSGKEPTPIHVPATKVMSAAPTVPPQRPSLPPGPPPRQPEPQFQESNIVEEIKTNISSHVRAPHGEHIFKKPTSPFIPRLQQKPPIKSAAGSVPSAPFKFKLSTGPHNSNFTRPKFLPRHVQASRPSPIPVQASPTYAGSRRSATETMNAVPTSTQLFVLNHADELFPTASQEAQELLEDELPANRTRMTNKPSPLAPVSPRPAAGISEMRPRQGKISHGRPPLMPVQGNQLPPAGDTSLDFPFLSTQDFVLSSQDMMELATPSNVRQDPQPNTTRPNNQRTSPGKRHVTQLQAPTESEAPSLPPIRTPCPDYGPGAQKSTPKTGAVRGLHGSKCMRQADQADCLSGHGYKTPGLQCPDAPSSRSQRVAAITQESNVKAGASGQRGSGLQHASGHAPSSCHSQSSAQPSQTRGLPGDKTAADQPQSRIVTPQSSRPKKRMFGSSGPGAEVLVAMERSFQQNLREERRREEALRAQARAMEAARQRETEQLARELADIIDDDELSDGWLSEDTAAPHQPGHAHMGAAETLRQTPSETPDANMNVPASQETDYGDFDFDAGDELGILADMAWVEDDLDGF